MSIISGTFLENHSKGLVAAYTEEVRKNLKELVMKAAEQEIEEAVRLATERLTAFISSQPDYLHMGVVLNLHVDGVKKP